MRNFILGIVITLLLLFLGGLAIATLGFLPTNADSIRRQRSSSTSPCPPWMPPWRDMPLDVTNPVPPTDENLIDGMKIYTMNCAGCHGNLDNKPSVFGESFYPSVPQLIIHPVDDPEWQTYYVTRTGIRYTGMPAWSRVLSEQDIWKVTAFLSRIEKLPPAVQEYWKQSTGTAPPAANPEGDEHSHHD